MRKVVLKTKYRDVKDGPVRFLLFFIGIVSVVFSIPCFFYLSTFYSGVMLIGLGIFIACFACMSTRKVTCPLCTHENMITVNRGNFACAHCKETIEVSWEK